MQDVKIDFSYLNIPRQENKFVFKLNRKKYCWLNVSRDCPNLLKYGLIGYSTSDSRGKEKRNKYYCSLSPAGDQYYSHLDNKHHLTKVGILIASIGAIAAILGALFGAITVIVTMSK